MDAFLIKTSEIFQWHHSEAGIKSCTAPQGLRARANCQQKKKEIFQILFETFPTENLLHYCYRCLSEHPDHNHPLGHFLLHLLPDISWYNERKKVDKNKISYRLFSVLSLCSDNDCKLPLFCKNGKKKGST